MEGGKEKKIGREGEGRGREAEREGPYFKIEIGELN